MNPFQQLADKLLAERASNEHWHLGIFSEATQYIRVNDAKIRQSGVVEDNQCFLEYFTEGPSGTQGYKRVSQFCTLSGNVREDFDRVLSLLKSCRELAVDAPVDAYAVIPKKIKSQRDAHKGKLLSRESASETLTGTITKGLDLVGIYASGPVSYFYSSTEMGKGESLTFETEVFSFDYSIYTPDRRAVSTTFAGKEWDDSEFQASLASSKEKVAKMMLPVQRIPRGKYKTYLEPKALSDLVGMFNWGCIGEGSVRQGDSALRWVKSGEKKFSPKFSLSDDLSLGLAPRFSFRGEVAPMVTPLIVGGGLKQTLVSERSALEYKIESNGAWSGEFMRFPSVAGGSLAKRDALKELGEGLYLSNLHYLNWSDQTRGRITGMTRFACFWVQNGEIKGPIENLRWDEELFTVFGDNLIDLTRETEWIPEVQTYDARQVGGLMVPGALVRDFNFTL